MPDIAWGYRFREDIYDGECDCPVSYTHLDVYKRQILGISNEEKRARTISATPLPRQGTPEDVAGLITFLVSEKADFMTGQAVNITGGRELH